MGVKKQHGPGGKAHHKSHYCPEHDLPCQGVQVNRKKMRYRCKQGCDLRRLDCVVK